MSENIGDKTKITTIYDIARLANVSPGTASRALNGIGYVKEETLENVLAAAKKLSYSPNRAARTLKTKKTRLILLAIPDTSNPFFFDLIESFLIVVKQNNYSMILYYTNGRSDEEINVIKLLREHIADGIMLINFHYSKKFFEEVNRSNVPIVLSGLCDLKEVGGKEGDNFDYISIDSAKGIYLAVKHLLKQGHTRIAYIAGSKDMKVLVDRYEGYCTAMLEANIKPDDRMVFWDDYYAPCGFKAADYFLSLSERPTAICTPKDLWAVDLRTRLIENGVRVPQDIAIVGMDNIDIVSKLDISTIAMGQSEIGRIGAEMIFNRINSQTSMKSIKTILEPRLVVRGSSIVIK